MYGSIGGEQLLNLRPKVYMFFFFPLPTQFIFVCATNYQFSIAFNLFCHLEWRTPSTKCLAIFYDFVPNLVNEQISSASSMKQRFFPLIFVTFTFLLYCNLIGMIP